MSGDEETRKREEEARCKAQAAQIDEAGRAASSPPGSGFLHDLWSRVKLEMQDPGTGDLHLGKVAVVGGGLLAGGLLSLATGGGWLLSILLGVGGAVAGFFASGPLFNWINKDAPPPPPPALARPEGLKPTPGYIQHLEVKTGEKKTGTTVTLPRTNEKLNPQPDIGRMELEQLRKKAEKGSPYTSKENRDLREKVKALQLHSDNWEVNLRATRKHFTDYNQHVRPAAEAYFEKTLHMSKEQGGKLLPVAPLHPTLFPASRDKPGYDALRVSS